MQRRPKKRELDMKRETDTGTKEKSVLNQKETQCFIIFSS